MTDASGTEKSKDGQVCSWCGVTFSPAVRQKTPVCPRCYRLLSSAGLDDKEIFGDEKQGESKDADKD